MTTVYSPRLPEWRDAWALDRALRQDCEVAELHGWSDVIRHLDAARSALLERMAPADRARAEAA